MPTFIIGEVHAVLGVNGDPSRPHALWQRIFSDGHSLSIDARQRVTEEFAEKRHAVAVNLDPVGMRVGRWNGLQLNLSALGIEPPDKVAPLHREPKYSFTVKNRRMRILGLCVRHLVLGHRTRSR